MVTLAEGAEKGLLTLCSGYVWGYPGFGKSQGMPKKNQPQLTPAQDCERKRHFREPRFVSDNQIVSHSLHPWGILQATDKRTRYV